jgi:ComF family protein
MLLESADVVVRVFLAPACAACDVLLDHPLRGAVCTACWQAVSRVGTPTCVRCGDQLPLDGSDDRCVRCRESPPRFVIARSAGRYDGSLRKIVHAFKYERRRALATPLAALMRSAGADLLEGADAVVPVPLHPLRVLRRGFNQADDLAVRLGLPVWRILRRTRSGPPQADLEAGRRLENVAQAFSVRYRFFPVRARRLAVRTVVLVDDVMTTGATLDACSAALVAAGIKEVRALTVARAVAIQPDGPRAPRLRATAPRR